ncbi:MAG: Acetyl-CoA acetyltransferase [Chloroflexi bacterium]|nr:MAG: Acetyl-CoA acetyltransferase [Chloroflexota bacterium]
MDKSMRNKTAIVGVGYSDMVRKTDRSLGSFAIEAAMQAITDAGLKPKDIDGYAGTPVAFGGGAMHLDGVDEISDRYIISSLGLPNIRWALDINGLTSISLVQAMQALAVGACDYALVVRAMYNPVGVRYNQSRSPEAGGPGQFTDPYGLVPMGRHAQWLQRYMHDSGATKEDLFNVVKALRDHAQLNPYAYWRGKDITLEDYLASRWIYEPLCLFDCDMPLTGAGAVVLTTAERAKDLPNPPAYISGFASTYEPGEAVFEASGIGRDEVQAAQLYDGYIHMIWFWLEKLGLCGKGEAYKFTRDGGISLGGTLPVTTFGGSQGEGRLHGMGHIREGAMQVMGRAGERQVPDLENCIVACGFESVPGHAFMFSRGS